MSCEAGSSPRMRGKPDGVEVALGERGLIPAHAGKTQSVLGRDSYSPAHPRACGENSVSLPAVFHQSGSSPRMRGKQGLWCASAVFRGLIPAHAGKTVLHSDVRREIRAHPRACGENAERSGVLALRSVRSWKTFSFPSSLKVTHCRAFVQLPFSRIRL